MPSSSLGLVNTGSMEVLKHSTPIAEKRIVALNAGPSRTTRTMVASSASPPLVEAIVVPRRTLLGWNLAMCLFHSTLAVATLTLGKIDLRVQLYRTVIQFQRRNTTGWDLVPSYVPEGQLHFTILTATFFLLSAVFHLMNATLLRSFYLSELAQCRTPTRWVEYSLSAPVMVILISYTLGIRERFLIFAIAVLIGITMPFGYWVETVARPASATAWTKPLSTRLTPWFLGNVPQLAAWLIIVAQFYYSNFDNDSMPWWLHIVLWGEVVLFFSFGFASVLSQWSQPRFFYRGELLFQALSLISKGLLGILLLANVLMFSRFEEVYE